MNTSQRGAEIVNLINTRGFLSVKELSHHFDVSEMTIRRDLEKLADQEYIRRTYGGAAPLTQPFASTPVRQEIDKRFTPGADQISTKLCHADVLVTTSLNPKLLSPHFSQIFPNIGNFQNLPIVSEALPLLNARTCVSINDYEAGVQLGHWAALYALEHWGGVINSLDLTYNLINTQDRSRGFNYGVEEIIPFTTQITLNPQSRYERAYQLTRDALLANPHINTIFCINDTNAWGALNACKNHGIDPQRIIILTIGMEGNTLKNAMMNEPYRIAGLAMFPEITAQTCVESAIAAYNNQPLPKQIFIPHAILTRENLNSYYKSSGNEWEINWETIQQELQLPFENMANTPSQQYPLPGCIGIMLIFHEHEWYQNLLYHMQAYGSQLGTRIEVIDTEQILRYEIEIRRRDIAIKAADIIEEGDVIIIDSGPLGAYLAEELKQKRDISVITNSVSVFEILKTSPEIHLILTGGVLRRTTQTLVGPTAENTLRDFRADKCFLMVTGVSLNFGLSHTNVSEITMKQTMIKSAREVILLADNSFFGLDQMTQVSPLNTVDILISDDALPASIRFELSKLGIQVMIA